MCSLQCYFQIKFVKDIFHVLVSVCILDKSRRKIFENNTNCYYHAVKLNEGPTLSQNSISAFSMENLKNCVICARGLAPPENSATNPTPGLPDEREKENSLASVPIQKTDDISGNSIVVQESNHSKSGWSLLPKKYLKKSLVRNASVFKRAFRKPNRHSSRLVHPDYKQSTIDHNGDPIPKELLGLQEKYSSSCTLYSFQELASATSNFAPGLFSITPTFPSRFYSGQLDRLS